MRTNPLSAAFLIVLAALSGSSARARAQEVNSLTAQEMAAGFALLFDGKTLEGWTTSADIKAWAVENGEIVIKPGEGWWLRTTRQYRDFELLLDFNLSKDANSGVGLRGSSVGDPAFTGMEVQILDTAGQAPSLTNCGAIYDAVAPSEMAVKPPGEWNTYRIKLAGETLNIWLNGEQIHKDVKLDDRGFVHTPDAKSPLKDRLTTGYIALQDHGNPVRFRNIKIHDLSPDADPGDFKPIFNSKDLTGWKPTGNAKWTVEEGTLVGRDGPGHLFTDQSWTDLEMRAMVKISAKGNSGFYFRTVPDPEHPDSWPKGYEAQVDNHDPKNFTGCIYDRFWPNMKAPATRDEAWFDYRVKAVGGRLQTWINGTPMVDADTEKPEFTQGHIALQGHNPGSVVMWRDIQVRDLRAQSQKTRKGAKLEKPVRVFYCTHSAGFRHDVLPLSRDVMKRLADENDWLEVTVSDNIIDLTPERLAKTDVVMFYTTGVLPMGDMLPRLMKWVKDGGGFVGVHAATDTLAGDPEYVRMIGGTFDGHPWNEQVAIVPDSPADPGSKSIADIPSGGKPFTIADEIYQFKSINPDIQVLMHLDPSTPKAEKGRPYPIAWTRTEGKGRVFYSALGHRPEVWTDDRYLNQVLAGIRWAAGRGGAK